MICVFNNNKGLIIFTSQDKIMIRDRKEEFLRLRRRAGDTKQLWQYRLQRRLDKLMEFDGRTDLRAFEQGIVAWETTSLVCNCCKRNLTSMWERQHHCRLCGLIICTDCSFFLPIRISATLVNQTRICLKCHSSLFVAMNSPNQETESKLSRDFRKFSHLKQQIQALMPKYQQLLEGCRQAEPEHLEAIHHEASAVRDTIMLQFVHFEATARLINEDVSISQYETLLRTGIFKAAQLFLNDNLFTLRSLPQLAALKKERKEAEKARELEILKESQSTSKMKRMKEIFAVAFGEEKKDTQVEKGIVLANLQSLLEKYRILKEQEESLKQQLESTDNQEDRHILKRALEECNQEIVKVERSIKQ